MGDTSQRAGEVTGRLRRGRRRDVIPLLLLLAAVLVCARVKGVSCVLAAAQGRRQKAERARQVGFPLLHPPLGAVLVPREARLLPWRWWRSPGSGSDAPRGPTAGCEKRQTRGASQLNSAQPKPKMQDRQRRARQGTAQSPTTAKQSRNQKNKIERRARPRRLTDAMRGRTDGESDQKSNDIEKQSDDAEPVSHAREGEASFEILLSCSPLLLALFLA